MSQLNGQNGSDMTTAEQKRSQAYEKRNLSGFEGDAIMHDRIKQLIKDFNIDLVIEGGTYLGGTARRFAMMCKEVCTIEINLEYFTRAQKTLELCHNVTQFFGSTIEVLPDLLSVHKDKNILFFSDAHWQEFNPMLAELEIIQHSGLKPVICIHDFKVPGHPELGFDTYREIVYEWEWIRPSIEKIYGVDGYVREYNSEAQGAKRGIIYLMPK
jgi:predicted O-methyltransferase YrrM